MRVSEPKFKGCAGRRDGEMAHFGEAAASAPSNLQHTSQASVDVKDTLD